MSGYISVLNYPQNNLVPGLFFSVDPSNANTASQPQRGLVIGQILSAGTYTPGAPVLTSGTSDVVAGAGGPNAMLAIMMARVRKSDPTGSYWALPLSDDGAATASVSTVTITGPATAAGTLALMVAGQQVNVGVTAGMTAAQIATATAAAANLIAALPATATASAGVVTFTADNKGAAAGDLDIRVNYYGAAGGQSTPLGVTVAFASTAVGATNPSTALSAALANLAAQAFDFIICPYTDTVSLNLIKALLDPTTGRWSWSQQLYGGCFVAFRGTVSARDTFAATRDDPFTTCIGFFDSPTPAYEWAADYGATCAASLRVDPALPLGGVGDGVNFTVLPPPLASQDIFSEQSTLLTAGMSVYKVEPSGRMRVLRAVNLYTTNAAGEPDNSFQDVETTYTLMAVLRALLISLSSQFGRKKLVTDGTVISGGQNFVTSQTVLAATVAIYRTLSALGLCDNPSAFAAAARATNAGNGVVTMYLPIEISNQLRVIAGDVAFSKP